MDIKELFKKISQGAGVSGYEDAIATILTDSKPLVHEVKKDALGNLILLKEGQGEMPRPKVMLAAHMDEIGLMVTQVDKRGFLRFTTIGGFDQRVLPAQEVVVHGKKELLGVIGAKSPHILKPEERNQTEKIEDLYIDVGFDSKEETEQWVQVGDLITLKREVVSLQGDHLAGKSFDDRAGVAALLECLKHLQKLHHVADVYFVATVQEEVGIRGAMTSTYGIVPHIGIAVDVGQGDMPGVPESQSLKLGNGPGIALGPHVHPKLYEAFVSQAKEWGIKHSVEPSPYPGGTDAYSMQVTQAGIPTILLSIPLRYMHTSVETLTYPDVVATGKLMALFIANCVDNEFVEGLLCF